MAEVFTFLGGLLMRRKLAWKSQSKFLSIHEYLCLKTKNDIFPAWNMEYIHNQRVNFALYLYFIYGC